MRGRGQRAEQHQPVAGIQAQSRARAGQAEQIHADHRPRNAEPEPEGNFFSEKQPQQGHQDKIQTGDKTGFAHAGKAYAVLLQGGGKKKNGSAP